MAIRHLEEDELGGLGAIWNAAGLPYRPNGRDNLRSLLKQWRRNPRYFLGAFMDGHLVGVAILTSDGRKGWINRLAVLQEERRRGIASLLVERAESILRREGLKLFCALIETENVTSIAMFKSLGYKVETGILYVTKREREAF